MDKAYKIQAGAIIDSALIHHGEVNAAGLSLEVDKIVEHKTEWQIAIEQRLDSLSAINNALSSQVTQLQHELAMRAEVCSQRR